MLISKEHSVLNDRYQKLLLKSMQQEKMLEKRDEDYKLLQSKFTPLNNRVDKLTETVQELKDENEQLIKIIKQRSATTAV